MNLDGRIRAAARKFDGKFGGMECEWTELFDHAHEFAVGLEDCPGEGHLREAVVAWMEKAANAEEEP